MLTSPLPRRLTLLIICLLTGAAHAGSPPLATTPKFNWTATDLAAGPDNLIRVLWDKDDGTVALWVVDNAGNRVVNNTYGPYSGWRATSLAVGGDAKMRVLWTKSDGTAALWQVAPGQQTAGGGGGAVEANWTFGPFTNWTARAVAAGPDNKARLLWTRTDGAAALWQLSLNGGLEVNNTYGPYTGGWHAASLAVGSDNQMRVLWDDGSGSGVAWLLTPGDKSNGGGQTQFSTTYGPYPGWTASRIAAGPDGRSRALWTNNNGSAALWVMGAGTNLDVNNTYGPYLGYTCNALAVGSDNKMRALWNKTDGQATFWQVASGSQSTGGGGLEVNLTFGPY